MTDTTPPRTLDYVPLDDLTPAPVNPKRHRIDVVDASMTRHGYLEPVVLDDRTGRVLSGHGRVETLTAKRDDGHPPPEGIMVDPDGRWLVPVVRGWASASDLDADAALVTVNRTVELGGWDPGELAPMLDRLADTPGGLDGVGYTPDEVAEMLGPDPIHVGAHDRTRPDPKAPAEVEHRVEPGDVWQLGPHRLACGSCTDRTLVDRLLGGATPAMLVTDPPYSSGGWQEAGRAAGSIGTTRTVDGQRVAGPQIANDRLSTRGYQALMSEMLNAAPCPAAYVFTDWRMWVNLYDTVEAAGFGVRSMIVWDKGSPGMGRGWRSQHELILHGARSVIEWDKHAGAQGNVLAFPRTGNPLHPTQKPVDLLRVLIANTPGATVYDPFAGSGSTLIAAHEENRHALCVELDPGYCDVILDRWERHGGTAPERIVP